MRMFAAVSIDNLYLKRNCCIQVKATEFRLRYNAGVYHNKTNRIIDFVLL